MASVNAMTGNPNDVSLVIRFSDVFPVIVFSIRELPSWVGLKSHGLLMESATVGSNKSFDSPGKPAASERSDTTSSEKVTPLLQKRSGLLSAGAAHFFPQLPHISYLVADIAQLPVNTGFLYFAYRTVTELQFSVSSEMYPGIWRGS